MGANFQTMTVHGDKTRKEVEEIFERAQDRDRYENGHCYSGGFGMAEGLDFPHATFDSEDAAYDWLDENCRKWDAAKAVTFKDKDGKAAWMIGAVCAS